MGNSKTYAFEGIEPAVHDDARVSVEATLVGDVKVEADASVWPGAVLRGDVERVSVGRQAHIGDNATLHGSAVGDQCMVGHGAVLDETAVGEGTLVGFNATLNSESAIGAGSIVAAGTVIQPDHEIPSESFVRGVPAEVTPLAETDIDPAAIRSEYSSGAYTDLANRHDELFGTGD